MKRRRFLQLSALGYPFADMGASGFSVLDQNTADRASPNRLSPGEWMDAWMKTPTRGADSQLIMGRFLEPLYFLTQPITWTPNHDQKDYLPVTAPVGFVTDLASIPRIFWSALKPDGQYAYAAIIHDYLYWSQTRPRKTADTIFKFAMQDFEVDPETVEGIFLAVRAGGGSNWNENQALKHKGEKRILKKFPPNARTRWTKWKEEPGVFADL